MEISKATVIYDRSERCLIVAPLKSYRDDKDFHVEVGIYVENSDEDWWDNITDVPQMYEGCNFTDFNNPTYSAKGNVTETQQRLMVYITQYEEQLNGDNFRAVFFDCELKNGDKAIICAWGTSSKRLPIMSLSMSDSEITS
jgi:hypothetical protein